MVYILLGEGFEEAEALVTADVLRRAEVPVSLTGIGGDFVAGSHGITVKTDVTVESVSLSGGDMVVLPGGLGGVASMEGSGPAMALIRQAAENPEIWLAAICAAPTLLARAGLLPQGVPCVCYPGMEGELEQAGARPQMDKAVVVHNKLITSQAPGTAFDFALALPEVEGADTVMVFYGTGREPDTVPLIQALLDRGKRVALPVVLPHRGMEARQVLALDRLVPNRFGIPEPDESCPAVPKGEIAVALVPHLMVDREGYRLGWGGGYYDRWLVDFPGFTVCVCRPGRLLERMPREEFDVPVKLVLIEE